MNCLLIFLICFNFSKGTIINVAFMKNATSSHILHNDEKNYGPRKAVDGKINTYFYSSVSGYIQLDLRSVYKIDFIILQLSDFNDNIGVYVGKRSPQENCTEVMKSERSFHHSTFILKYSCMKKEAKHVKVESKSYNLRINELEVYADVHSRQINIALNKETSVLKTNEEQSPGCVDGMMAVCVETSFLWLKIDIKEVKNINYIHLYATGDAVSAIKVSLDQNFKNYIKCYKTKQTNDEKKYFCFENKSKYISIPHTTGLKEVEAFSLMTDWKDHYIGCYEGTKSIKYMADDLEDVETCLILCRNERQKLALIQESKCYCDNTLPSTCESSAKCSSKCRADQNPCGSSQYFSVYQTKYLKYLDCFKDQTSDRVIYGHKDFISISKNSIELCWTYCSKQGHQYFGLEYGNECFCGKINFKHGTSTECNYRCPGNERQICGGSKAISVYEACPNFSHNLNACSINTPHCERQNSQESCDDRCKTGWEGSRCSKRNCLKNNGDCGNHSCKMFPFRKDEISECVCRDGFFKTNYNGFCEDRDECKEQSDICDKTSSTCLNTQGSYECVCKSPGFKKVDSKTCEDINECDEGTHTCGLNEACVNGHGSFSCDCLPGYAINETECKDVNECLESVCNKHTHVCLNLPGSYSCQFKKNTSIGLIGGLIAMFLVITIILIVLFFTRRKVKSFVQKKSLKIVSFKTSYESVDVISTEIREENPITTGETRVPLKDIGNYYLTQEKLISEQFMKCPKTTDSPKEIGSNSKVSVKNRFKSVYPYDYNRVVLEGNDSDPLANYINASFISTYETNKDYSFIATQGPKEKTIEDFWKMLVQYSVSVVVMLTKCFEEGMSKCNQYWPTDGSETYGLLHVSVTKTSIQSNVETRVFSVKDQNGNVHVVRHILYKAWPDKSVPINAMDLLNIRSLMLDFLKEAKVIKHHPNDKLFDTDAKIQYVVVHCSAGVGRTGTFICLDNLVYEADHKGSVDILEAMMLLRKQRCFMVQTKDQYKLCYKCICLYHELGNDSMVRLQTKNQIKKQIDELNKISAESCLMEKQFKMIHTEIASKDFKDNNKANIDLDSGKLEVVYVPSAKKPSKYLMGVIPKSLSMKDLIEVIKNHASVVVLIEPQKSLQSFLEELNKQHKSKTISLIKESKTSPCHIAMFYNGNLDDFRDNNIYCNIEVSEENMPGLKKVIEVSSVNHETATYVYNVIKQESDDDFIMLLSRNNYNESSLLVASLQIAESVEACNSFDVYQSAYYLKFIERSCFDTFDSFKRVYDIAEKLSENYFECFEKGIGFKPNVETPCSDENGNPCFDESLYQNYQECDKNLYENAFQ